MTPPALLAGSQNYLKPEPGARRARRPGVPDEGALLPLPSQHAYCFADPVGAGFPPFGVGVITADHPGQISAQAMGIRAALRARREQQERDEQAAGQSGQGPA